MMKQFLENMKRMFRALLLSYNEYLPMFTALILWWMSRYFTRFIDPTAAVDDAGLLQALLFGVVLYFTAQACAWFSMRVAFPKIGKYLDDNVAQVFDGLTVRQRVWIAISLFAFHFLGAVLIFGSAI